MIRFKKGKFLSNSKMSLSRVPHLDELSAPQDDFIVPELCIQPPTPRLPSEESEAIDIPWIIPRHWSTGCIFTMHESRSARLLDGLNPPLSRDRRSQSVPLSLNAVALSKKLVNVSDRFEAKHQAVKMREKERSRTVSEGETTRSSHPKRHSDLIEQRQRERVTTDELPPKIGSSV